MTVSVFTNILLVVIKILGGIIGKSGALLADGIHSLSDLVTDFVAIIGGIFSKKPADDKHPFGHHNIEYVTSLGISLVILGVGFSIIQSAFARSIVLPDSFVMIISFFTILVKFILARFVLFYGNKFHNQILIASGKESSSDVISSCIVFISCLFMQLSRFFPIFQYADKLAAIIVGCFVFNIGFDIFKDNLSFMIGEKERDEKYLSLLYEIILSVEGVASILDFVLLKYGEYYKFTGTVCMDAELTLKEAHHIVDEVEQALIHFDQRIHYISIHMEPEEKTTIMM